MNYFKTRFSNGAAKVSIIFKLPNLFAKIFQFLFSCSVFLRTLQLFSHPFFKWECKGTTFFDTCNTFTKKFCTFFNIFHRTNPNELIINIKQIKVVIAIDFH